MATVARAGFSNWNKVTALKEVYFLVDNDQLQSKHVGLTYRSSMDIEDKCSSKAVAKFGKPVCGILHTEDGRKWLQVQDQGFLPLAVNGKDVLLKIYMDEVGEEDVVDPADLEAPHNPDAFAGNGALFEVMSDTIHIRSAPSNLARPLGSRKKGKTIELFDWSDDLLWRRLVLAGSGTQGWTLLDSPEFGALMRPKGIPFTVKPIPPLCLVAMEGDEQHVMKFIDRGMDLDVRDAGDRTPLMIAAQLANQGTRYHEVCVLLLRDGANPLLTMRSGETAMDLATSKPLAALLRALSGLDSNRYEVNEALADLRQSTQKMAETMIQEQQERERAGGTRPPPKGAATSPEKEKEKAKRGNPFKVLLDTVSVLEEPNVRSSEIAEVEKGEIVNVLSYDSMMLFARVEVKTEFGLDIGWILIVDDEEGEQIRPLTSVGRTAGG